MGEDVIAVIAVSLIFGGIPITAILTHHFRKIAEINARKGGDNSGAIQKELAAMRQEMAELRDTSTRFDVSFDAAITRLEQRMDRTETILEKVAPQTTITQPTTAQEDITVQLRR